MTALWMQYTHKGAIKVMDICIVLWQFIIKCNRFHKLFQCLTKSTRIPKEVEL